MNSPIHAWLEKNPIDPTSQKIITHCLPSDLVGHPFFQDEAKMQLAIDLARHNVLQNQGGPFGAAIFEQHSGLLIAVGVNKVIAQQDSTAHAEIEAIRAAQTRLACYTLYQRLGGRYELFTSAEPCAMCLGAIAWAGLSRVVCAAKGEDARSIGFDEGPVFEQSYEYLKNLGIEITFECKRSAAVDVMRHYLALNLPIYNGCAGSSD